MAARLVIVVVCVQLVALTAASADVLCQRRSGVVVVRPAECKKRETRLDPVALGLQGPAGPVQTLDVQTVTNQQSAAGGLQAVEATCPNGSTLTGGGAGIGSQDAVVGSSASDVTPNAWKVIYYVTTPGVPIVAQALCAHLNGATP
jgi:hypothetical protein